MKLIVSNVASFCVVTIFCAPLLFQGCKSVSLEPSLQLIHLVDQQEMVETISNDKRLRELQKRDFTSPQPYKKVLRSFRKDGVNRQKGVISSYYPNGQLMQWLETSDGRALGQYREWHSNGQIKISAQIVGGIPDLTPQAQESWQFDQECKAWCEKGQLLAQIAYQQGARAGLEKRFWPTGVLREELSYQSGVLEGSSRQFDEAGHLSQLITYSRGVQEGRGIRYWSSARLSSFEFWERGQLRRGRYWSPDGKLVGSVRGGRGERVLFAQEKICERQSFVEGEQRGRIEYFDLEGHLVRIAHFSRGEKEGQEVLFYTPAAKECAESQNQERVLIQKLEMTWQSGKLQGPVRTWFASGQLQSHHERSQNRREGICTCYYPSGQVMLMEHYRLDRLLAGQYFALGDRAPYSTVVDGKGTATLFDETGTLTNQITYQMGWPQ